MVSDADLGEARILIVDDEDANVALLERILRGAGYHDIVSTTDPRLVQELFAVLDPDLVLLDLMMPVMDGWEFRREQQRDPQLAGVPVIVLSALDQTRVGDVGEVAFLKKPLDFDRLLELVRRYCQ